MRKYLIVLAALFAGACAKNEDVINQPPTQNPDNTCATNLDNNDITIYEFMNNDLYEYGDGKYDALGHGSDVIDQYASRSTVRFAIIDIEKLVSDYPEYVKEEYSADNEEYYYYNYSSNAYEYCYKLSKQQIETSNNPIFTRTLSYYFPNMMINGAFDKEFVCASYELIIPKKSLSIEAPIYVLANYTTSYFKNDINSLQAQRIVNKYGTHVLTSIKIGGRFRLKYISKTINSDREQASKAGIKSWTNNVIGMANNEEVDMSVLCKNYLDIRALYSSGSNKYYTIENGKMDITEWKSGVTLETASMCDLWGDNALIPIYEFITDSVKKEEIKAHIEQYIIENKAYLSE